ncbi:MAG: hypothetical protein KJN72_13460 [Woeseia sp.]|nr:hypothetical protein [Woeseia sp.]
MESIAESMRFVHVVFGAVGLAAFWVPVFAKKGAKVHILFGKIFTRSAYVVLAAAALALLLRFVDLQQRNIGVSDNPMMYSFIVFLGYLTYVTYVIVRHGMAVLQHKGKPHELATPIGRGLAIGSIVASMLVILFAITVQPANQIVLYALSPIGFGTGSGMLRYMRGGEPSSRGWMYEHLGSMLGAGIAFHTAFAVFGAARLFDIGLTGWVAVIPWVLPAAVGIPATVLWTRHYRKKFGELQNA